MCCQDEDLGNLDMCRRTGSIEADIGNVIAVEGLDAFVYVVGTLRVAMEADVGEVGLYESGLMSVTRMFVSATSMRRPSESALTAAFVEQ